MCRKIVLIDGHSILNRAFYGMPDLTNSEGLHTGAVYGFLNIMFRILDEEAPDALAVAFDVHAPTFRHRIYSEYKGTRKPMPEELRSQVPILQDVLRAMGVRIVMMAGYEADDLLGTIACRCEREGMRVTIVSGDRDLLQLATESILVRLPKTKNGKTVIEDYHAAEVLEVFGVTAPQIVELKALMGDSSDNIPGVPGVGVKTATKIIAAYGDIENARAHADEIRPPKAAAALTEHYDLAELSRTLAKINTESPVDFDPADAPCGNLYTREAYEWFRRLDFRNLLPRFDSQNAVSEQPLSARTVTDKDEAEALIARAAGSKEVGLALLGDTDLTLMHPSAAGLALAFSRNDTCYIPASEAVSSGRLLEAAAQVLSGADSVSVYDLKDILRKVPVPEREGLFDIRTAAYLLDPLTSEPPFDVIAKQYADLPVRTPEEIFGGKKAVPAAEMETEKAALYAGELALSAILCRKPLEEALAEAGMLELFETVEMPLSFVLCEMERAGIAVEAEALAAYGERLAGRIAEAERQICEAAGEVFNINSPKQLGVILFEKMKLPGGRKTKTGYSTAADVLEKLAEDNPFVRDILEYRQLTKLKSTYADGLAAVIGPDGRIHSRFHQTITATGRISSSDPNLQNIPVRLPLGREIRRVFVAKEGAVLLDADYSQIELRVLAHLSGDEKLIAAYREEKDIHAITASQVFHVPFDQVTPLQRRNAKAVNFGIVYGISSFGLSQDLDISRAEAAEYIGRYFATYPGIKAYLDGLVASAKEKGYSETMFGRRRPVPELTNSNFMQRQFGERVAMNAPIQGTAADIIKIAMIRVSRRLKAEGLRSRLILQVHDELLIEAAEDELEACRKILSEEMSGAAALSVRLETDMHTGHTWYDAK